VDNCTKFWFQQPIDHFTPNIAEPSTPSHFKQRYFVCRKEHWKPGGPVFFYTGNEANVELYVNATGLMWESAPAFGALLVFAEHRYFGESFLFNSSEAQNKHMEYLSTEQALPRQPSRASLARL